MAKEKDLIKALDILTEGDEADMPQSLRATAKAGLVKTKAKPWTMGKGIQGVGIGNKISDGVELDELVIKVYVDKKRPKSDVTNLVPRVVDIEGLDAIQTDVEAIGKVRRESNTIRVRPAIPGYSVGHVNITAGTLGCLVKKRGNASRLYILSNSHVLADEGTGKAGDEILQPGPADGGKTPGDVIAKLSEWVPFDFTTATFPNLVDAAIAELNDPNLATSAINQIGKPTGVSSKLQRGMQVQKSGRTTDYTIGVIRDLNYRTALRYKKPDGGRGRVGFRDQILCTRFTAGGDSGSAVMNMQQQVVGLHFAGSDSSSIFNRIQNVLDALDIEIVL